jgi:hypothetical protein
VNLSLSLGNKKISFRIEILFLIVIFVCIIWIFTLGSTCKIGYQEGMNLLGTAKNYINTTFKEGFSGNNVAFSSQFGKANKQPTNTSNWSMGSLVYTPGEKADKSISNIWNRAKQPIPLPKGELNLFASTPFKPECCPNAYSNSTGCACMTVDQYNYLKDRGGNNVPYSEY